MGQGKGKGDKSDREGEKRSERSKQDKDSASSKLFSAVSHPAASTSASHPSSAGSSPSSPASAPSNAFGGAPMSAEFESWCKEHLTPLTHSSDLSLPHYLMTLESPADIREYIYEYLGSSAGVQQFADGFIAMKEFETGQEKVKGGKALAGEKDKVAATATKEKEKDDDVDAGADGDKKSRRRRRRKNEEF